LAPGAQVLLKEITNVDLPESAQVDVRKQVRRLTISEWSTLIEAFDKWPFAPEVRGIRAIFTWLITHSGPLDRGFLCDRGANLKNNLCWILHFLAEGLLILSTSVGANLCLYTAVMSCDLILSRSWICFLRDNLMSWSNREIRSHSTTSHIHPSIEGSELSGGLIVLSCLSEPNMVPRRVVCLVASLISLSLRFPAT
jgi:hypothetical protein